MFWGPTGKCCEKCNFGVSDWKSNPWPREPGPTLYKLSYGGRCQAHGYESSILRGGNADEVKGILNRILWDLHSTTDSQIAISDERKFWVPDAFILHLELMKSML